jgi:porphobilinogen synthase
MFLYEVLSIKHVHCTLPHTVLLYLLLLIRIKGFGDKKTYQQDPGNSREAVREAELDVAEGADMLMIKPGMPYLDIIRRLRDTTNVPLAAYQVSGEYCMIKAAAMKNWLNEKQTVLESLLCFRRAGADVILSYYAKDAAKWMFEEAHEGLSIADKLK